MASEERITCKISKSYTFCILVRNDSNNIELRSSFNGENDKDIIMIAIVSELILLFLSDNKSMEVVQ